MFVVLVLYVVFGVWFAVAKIRLRHKLGGMSAVLGSTELLIGALHLTMLAIGIGSVAITVVENPDIDEAAIDELFNARVKVAIMVSGASYCVWSVVRGANAGFDQNRVFFGFGLKCDPDSPHRVEVGYLNQYVNHSAGADLSNHLLSINVYWSP